MGGEPPPGYSSGGMRTKLVAARIATQAGCAMAIAIGKVERPLLALENGARCTWFLPVARGAHTPQALDRRIAVAAGRVDGRCRRRAGIGKRDRSLLPAGVRVVEGAFGRGDPVTVLGPDGAVARPRPVRLCQRRCRTHCRPPLGRDRGDPGLARPR